MPEKSRYEAHNERRTREIHKRTAQLGNNPGARLFANWKLKKELEVGAKNINKRNRNY